MAQPLARGLLQGDGGLRAFVGFAQPKQKTFRLRSRSPPRVEVGQPQKDAYDPEAPVADGCVPGLEPVPKSASRSTGGISSGLSHTNKPLQPRPVGRVPVPQEPAGDFEAQRSSASCQRESSRRRPVSDEEEDDPLMAAVAAKGNSSNDGRGLLAKAKAKLPKPKLPRPTTRTGGSLDDKASKRSKTDVLSEVHSKLEAMAAPHRGSPSKQPAPTELTSQQPPSTASPLAVAITNAPVDYAIIDVKELCRTFGNVVYVKSTGERRFEVLFRSASQAAAARSALNGLQVRGRSQAPATLRCLPADAMETQAPATDADPTGRRRSRWEEEKGSVTDVPPFSDTPKDTVGGAEKERSAVGGENAADDDASAPWHRLKRQKKTDVPETSWSETECQKLRNDVTNHLNDMGKWRPGERTRRKLERVTAKIVSDVTAFTADDAHERMIQLYSTLRGALGEDRAQEVGKWLSEYLETSVGSRGGESADAAKVAIPAIAKAVSEGPTPQTISKAHMAHPPARLVAQEQASEVLPLFHNLEPKSASLAAKAAPATTPKSPQKGPRTFNPKSPCLAATDAPVLSATPKSAVMSPYHTMPRQGRTNAGQLVEDVPPSSSVSPRAVIDLPTVFLGGLPADITRKEVFEMTQGADRPHSTHLYRAADDVCFAFCAYETAAAAATAILVLRGVTCRSGPVRVRWASRQEILNTQAEMKELVDDSEEILNTQVEVKELVDDSEASLRTDGPSQEEKQLTSAGLNAGIAALSGISKAYFPPNFSPLARQSMSGQPPLHDTSEQWPTMPTIGSQEPEVDFAQTTFQGKNVVEKGASTGQWLVTSQGNDHIFAKASMMKGPSQKGSDGKGSETGLASQTQASLGGKGAEPPHFASKGGMLSGFLSKGMQQKGSPAECGSAVAGSENGLANQTQPSLGGQDAEEPHFAGKSGMLSGFLSKGMQQKGSQAECGSAVAGSGSSIVTQDAMAAKGKMLGGFLSKGMSWKGSASEPGNAVEGGPEANGPGANGPDNNVFGKGSCGKGAFCKENPAQAANVGLPSARPSTWESFLRTGAFGAGAQSQGVHAAQSTTGPAPQQGAPCQTDQQLVNPGYAMQQGQRLGDQTAPIQSGGQNSPGQSTLAQLLQGQKAPSQHPMSMQPHVPQRAEQPEAVPQQFANGEQQVSQPHVVQQTLVQQQGMQQQVAQQPNAQQIAAQPQAVEKVIQQQMPQQAVTREQAGQQHIAQQQNNEQGPTPAMLHKFTQSQGDQAGQPHISQQQNTEQVVSQQFTSHQGEQVIQQQFPQQAVVQQASTPPQIMQQPQFAQQGVQQTTAQQLAMFQQIRQQEQQQVAPQMQSMQLDMLQTAAQQQSSQPTPVQQPTLKHPPQIAQEQVPQAAQQESSQTQAVQNQPAVDNQQVPATCQGTNSVPPPPQPIAQVGLPDMQQLLAQQQALQQLAMQQVPGSPEQAQLHAQAQALLEHQQLQLLQHQQMLEQQQQQQQAMQQQLQQQLLQQQMQQHQEALQKQQQQESLQQLITQLLQQGYTPAQAQGIATQHLLQQYAQQQQQQQLLQQQAMMQASSGATLGGNATMEALLAQAQVTAQPALVAAPVPPPTAPAAAVPASVVPATAPTAPIPAVPAPSVHAPAALAAVPASAVSTVPNPAAPMPPAPQDDKPGSQHSMQDDILNLISQQLGGPLQ